VIRLAAQCVAAGADDVGLSDTTGYANPAQVHRLYKRLRAELGPHAGAAHMHNTRGLGLTNCLAAYDGSGSGFSPMFNRHKKSLAPDLQTPEGMEAVLKLIATADIASENFKPGTMAKLGLAYMTGRPSDPLRAGISVNDIMGGMFGAIGAMAALAQRDHPQHGTGAGQEIQSALFENNVF
jgi:crotonobetainyl-CoA:carnitine CoA-transferase CaiB-like acyl-CoA transferase